MNEIIYLLGFPGGAVGKDLPTSAETQVGSLGQKNPLEEKMTTGVPVFLPGLPPFRQMVLGIVAVP